MATEGTRGGGSTSIGARIAGHRVARLIGAGTLGRVFECYTPDDRRVAIKLLRSRSAALGDALLRDARTLVQVRSPHVVTVHDVSTFNGAPFLVMEIVDGEDLRTRIKRGPLRSAEALTLVSEAAEGLQALWAQGLAHGDVRPANLLVTTVDGNDCVKVVDAGLAPPVAGTDALRGSPEYLAPERLIGTPADVLTDIYALGCTLYELLSGAPPFEGDPTSLFDQHAHAPVPPLSTSPSVVDLVMRMLAKDRSLRQKTWGEVIDGIQRALDGLGQAPPQKLAMPTIDVALDENTDPFNGPRTAEVPAFTPGTPGAVNDASGPRAKPAAPPAAPPSALPVTPLLPAEFGEDSTVVRAMNAPPAVPSAEDIGLVLEPLDERRSK